MKKFIRPTVFTLALSLFLLSGVVESLVAQDASDDATVSAEVLADLSISAVGAIDFGQISQNIPESFNGDNPLIDPRDSDNDENISEGQTARFLINGAGSQTVLVGYDATVTLNPEGGTGGTINFQPDVIGEQGDDSSTERNASPGDDPINDGDPVDLDASGDYTVWVGGQLHRDGDLSADTYEGTFTVTVDYDL